MALFLKTLASLLCVSFRCNGVQFASVDLPQLGHPVEAVNRKVGAENQTDRREQMSKYDEGLRLPQAPMEPGCFIRKVKGCPLHPQYSDTTWRRATHAEEVMQAGVNRTACEVDVKVAAMKWCGTEEMEVLFIPPRAGTAEQVQEQPDERRPTAWSAEVPRQPEARSPTVQEQPAGRPHTEWSREGRNTSIENGQEQPKARNPIAWSTQNVQDRQDGVAPKSWSADSVQKQPEGRTPSAWSTEQVQQQPEERDPAEQPAGRTPTAQSTERVQELPDGIARPAWSTEKAQERPYGRAAEQPVGRTPDSWSTARVQEQPQGPAPPAWSTPTASSETTVQEQPEGFPPLAWSTEKVEAQPEGHAAEQPVRRTSTETVQEQPFRSTGQVQDRVPTAAWNAEKAQEQPEGTAPLAWSTEKADEQPEQRTPVAWRTEEVAERIPRNQFPTGQAEPLAGSASTVEPPANSDKVGERGAAEADDENQQPDTIVGPAVSDASREANPASPLTESSGDFGVEEWNVQEEDIKYPEQQVPDAGDRDRKPHQLEMSGEKPTEPGCFVRTPSGCPKHPSSTTYYWQHDEFAERSTQARVNRAACEVDRKARMAAWCGAEDVEMLFIPPFRPGCYARTPSGCPNHPTFANISWMREEYGGQLTQPLVNRSACEVARKQQLGEWCGSEDVETLFVPVGAQQQQQDSLPGMDEHHRSIPDAPTEPGCYVRTPSGCPAHPSSSNAEWKHDGYAERSTKALKNRTMCEEVRGAAVRRWCGVEDVEMLHVPKPTPGCYMRTPSGCLRHPVFASKTWKHEEYGEGNTLAKVSRTVCEVNRKASVVKWCGSDDVQMSFVPPDWGSLLKVNATPRRGGREPEIPLPAEPGCFVRTPSGCPNHPLFNSSKWKHESHGEKKMKTHMHRQVCEGERKSQVRHWCGAEDVEMLFVPPIEPGCYMRLPAGCPYHSYYVAQDWVHEENGEAYGTARWDRRACETDRKAHLAQWCGTPEVEMLFIPAVLP